MLRQKGQKIPGSFPDDRDPARDVDHYPRLLLLYSQAWFCFYPLDATLDLSPRKKQDDLQSLALEFLAKMPFEEASALFLKATGISFSDNRIHGLFADFMADATAKEVIPAADEIERRIRKVTGKGKRRPVLVAAVQHKVGVWRIPGSQRVSSLPPRQGPSWVYS